MSSEDKGFVSILAVIIFGYIGCELTEIYGDSIRNENKVPCTRDNQAQEEKY